MTDDRPVTTCPRCSRSTASPFGAAGVCLRCAGERVLALNAGDFAEEPTDESDLLRGARPGAMVLPDRIGPYEIIEELGRGGMGCIYAARQVGLGRIVALKVLATHGDLAGLDLRFLREAQTVARLHHPHIVAVYDSGRVEGYVYFSMEYLSDGDLGRRLRTQPFTPRQAAVLIGKVASAVAAAHAEGVLHRDIKPSNILLDGDEPKLADFGLAAELEPGGDLTSISGVLGTPHYLAPEALRGGSAALTVSSDIYALGALLYECLSGRTPFAGASPAELPALVEQTDPPPPHLLVPAVPRDLDTICLTCLERDPARRYRSAAALAADLRRFLEGQPIQARPPGRVDRWRKYAARHRAEVMASAVTAFVLVAATGVSVTLALRARRAERQAAGQAATATALAAFLKDDLLAQAGPDAQPDRNLTLHTVLDRAAGRLDGRFPAQPLVEADLHGVIGEVYDSLGDYDAARQHLERRLEVKRTRLGELHPETLAAMHELAGTLFDSGKLAEAEALARRTLALRRRVLGPDAVESIDTANMIGMLLRDRGKLTEADRLQSETVAVARRALPPQNPQLITAVRTLGTIRLALFRYADAELLLREAANRQIAAKGPEDVSSLTALNDLATVYRQEGKLDEAAELYQRVLSVRRRVLGAEHPHTILSMNNLASVFRIQGQLAKAEALQVTAVDAGTRTLGRDHPRVLIMLGNLAETYRLEQKRDLAIAVMSEAVDLSRRVHGPTHPGTIGALGTLADMLATEGQFVRAEALLREALEGAAGSDVPSWRIDSLRSLLGLVLAREGRFADAEPLLVEALESLRRAGPDIPVSNRTLIQEADARLAEFRALKARL